MEEKVRKLKWDVNLAIKLYEQYHNVSKVAKELNISASTVIKRFKKLGIQIDSHPHLKFDEHAFDKIDSEEKAYWLGFIYADGYVRIQKDTDKHARYDFELSLSKHDIDHLYKFDKFMKSNTSNVKVGVSKVNGKEFERCRWSVGNKNLWTQLNNKGVVPQKSLILTFPTENQVPKEFQKAFIRGYFDGDGSVSTKETSKSVLSVQLIGTQAFLEKVLEILNISANVHLVNSISQKTYHISLAIQKGTNFLNQIYSNATIYLDRKYNLYKNYCRSMEKSIELLETNIGEGWDANPEITEETKESSAS